MRKSLGRTSLPKLLLGGAIALAATISASSLSYAIPYCPHGQHWVQLSPGRWGCGYSNYWDNWATRQHGPRKHPMGKGARLAPVDGSMIVQR